MKKHLIIAATVLASTLGVTGVTVATAASEGNNADKAEKQALMSATLSAQDAIKAVEAAQPGKIAGLQFNLEKDAPSYEVTVVAADGIEHDFMVDASSGTVSKIAANEHQNGDQGDNENGSENGESDNN